MSYEYVHHANTGVEGHWHVFSLWGPDSSPFQCTSDYAYRYIEGDLQVVRWWCQTQIATKSLVPMSEQIVVLGMLTEQTTMR